MAIFQGRFLCSFSGQILVFFSLAVAAAEAVVGLAIIIAIFRNNLSVDITKVNLLRW